MKLIKLTKDGETKNSTKWEIDKTVSIAEKLRRPELCSDGVLHAYRSLEQALVMKIKHLHYGDADLKIYEVEGDVVVEDYDKLGCYELTPIKEIPLPGWYTNIELRLKILTRFVCYCALEVIDIFEDRYPNDDGPRRVIDEALKYGTDEFNADATARAVNAAYATADTTTYAPVVGNAVYAAAYAADVAHAAVNTATYAADAARVANAIANAIYTAAYAADAANTAAAYAADDDNATDFYIDITALMQKAIKDFELN